MDHASIAAFPQSYNYYICLLLGNPNFKGPYTPVSFSTDGKGEYGQPATDYITVARPWESSMRCIVRMPLSRGLATTIYESLLEIRGPYLSVQMAK